MTDPHHSPQLAMSTSLTGNMPEPGHFAEIAPARGSVSRLTCVKGLPGNSNPDPHSRDGSPAASRSHPLLASAWSAVDDILAPRESQYFAIRRSFDGGRNLFASSARQQWPI